MKYNTVVILCEMILLKWMQLLYINDVLIKWKFYSLRIKTRHRELTNNL